MRAPVIPNSPLISEAMKATNTPPPMSPAPVSKATISERENIHATAATAPPVAMSSTAKGPVTMFSQPCATMAEFGKLYRVQGERSARLKHDWRHQAKNAYEFSFHASPAMRVFEPRPCGRLIPVLVESPGLSLRGLTPRRL
jgi:hypothetical protein